MARLRFTLTVLLAMGLSVAASPLEKIDELDANDTMTTTERPSLDNKTDDGMQGDQAVAQHYVRTSDGSGRYKIRTLIPGKQYVISAQNGQHALHSKEPVHHQNYVGEKPDYAQYRPREKEFPWCGNPYICSDGGNICASTYCLQGSFCCRTYSGLCCFRSNSGNVKRQVNITVADVLKKPVDYSIKVTPKPVYAYTRPPPAEENAHVPYKPSSSGQYNAYDYPPVVEEPRSPPPQAHIPQPMPRAPPTVPPRSPYQPNYIDVPAEKPAVNSRIHPLFGNVQVESEDEEAEQVLNKITGLLASPYIPPPASEYGVGLAQPSMYPTPHTAQQYPAPSPQLLVPAFPSHRYPRSHYLHSAPYSSVQQIAYPPQVFHEPEPPFLLHTHSKRETQPPYADLQQVYYPSQVFYPAPYSSNVHVKREAIDPHPQVYYPSQVFYPYDYRIKRQAHHGVPEDYEEVYYPSQNFYPVRTPRRNAYWDVLY